MEDKKVLLKVEDLNVKFRVRGRILTAIRGISLDIYEGESIAIVGESGSGKSVFTKTFAGMLDSNGFIDQGRLIFNDEELADTVVVYDDKAKKKVSEINAKLDELSKYEFGAATYKKMLELESEKRQKCNLSDEEKSSASDDKIYNQVKEEATEEVMDKIEKLYNNKNVDKIRIEVGVAWPYGNHNYTKPGEKLVGSKIAYIKTFNFTREDYKDFLKQYKEEN